MTPFKIWLLRRIPFVVIIAVGAFTLSAIGYIVLLTACFLGVIVGDRWEVRHREVKHDQDSGNRVP